MKLSLRPAVLTLSVALASSGAMGADIPTVIGCAKGATSAELLLTLTAKTSLNQSYEPTCPLLQDKELRKLVDKFGAGTVFAHPAIPGLCLTGTVQEGGTLTFEEGGPPLAVDADKSYSESAQRLFPVPREFSVFATSADGTLQAGAAMTAVHIEAGPYNFDVLLDDHFLASPPPEGSSTPVDTEDFLVVGSRGSHKVSGRLSGRGTIVSAPTEQEPNLPLIINLTVEGSLCLQ